jgi:DHA2 family multidrug resistance protein-like MFS transporter
VLAAFSSSASMLVVARALLGIAGATLAPSTLSLIRNMFLDPHQRTVAISVWIMSFSAGAAIGPLVGGALLEYFWWGSVFLINVPVMALLLALGPVLLPESRDPNAGRLDLASAAQSLLAVLAVIYGLKRIAEQGVDGLSAASIVAGLALGVAFVRRQRRLADPLIDLALFRIPTFSAAIATNVLGFLATFGTFLFIAQYLQSVIGLSPLQAGLWSTPAAVAFIVGSMVTPWIVRSFSPAHVIAGGMLVSAAGFLLLALVGRSTAPLAVLVAGSVIFSVGLTPVVTLTTDLVLGSAPPERAGSAAAISETSSEFGGALGIALLGSVITALYGGAMAGIAIPGVPPDAVSAARSTIGGAVATAALLPDAAGAELLGAARAAFSRAFTVTALIGAGISIGVAALAVVLLRRVQPVAHPAQA